MQKKMLALLIIIQFILSSLLFGGAFGNEPTKWPVPDWETKDNDQRMKTRECINFKNFAVNNKKFQTDGLIVIKDGMVHYEYYDPTYDPETPHDMYSVSKTITGALLGMAERDGRISLDDKLSEYYPKKEADQNYEKITMKNLLYMDAGLIWDEAVKRADKNSIIKAYYGPGYADMASYVARGPRIPQGPGYKWTYSTGIPTVIMGVLKQIYGPQDTDMPWRNLFNPLGMKNTVFERDLSGTFVGGFAVFSTPRDLAKLGYLYLNNGYWNGEVLLPPEWIKKMLTISPGYLSPGTIVDDVEKVGVYGGSIWLNRQTPKAQGKPFPNVPEDMYMALGFMGQLLIMIPSLNIIIVRTGYDQEIHSKLNEFMSRAIQCFHDPSHVVGISKPAKNPATMGLFSLIKNIKSAIDANTLQSSMAKIICSCHFVTAQSIPVCLKRNNLTLSKLLTKINIKEKIELNGQLSIQVRLARFARLFKHHMGEPAKATYDPLRPELGCTLN